MYDFSGNEMFTFVLQCQSLFLQIATKYHWVTKNIIIEIFLIRLFTAIKVYAANILYFNLTIALKFYYKR